MIRILSLSLVVICFSTAVRAQIGYTYDDVGNRVERKVLSLRPANPNEGTEVGTTEDQASETVEARLGDMAVTLSPNPTLGTITITGGSGDIIEIVVLTSLSGGTIEMLKSTQLPLDIDLSHLAPGAYFVSLIQGNKKETIKIIKQ